MKLTRFQSAEEASACRKAFEHAEVGTWVVHCHHEEPFEQLTEPRRKPDCIYFILEARKNEQALRLRLLRTLPQPVGEKLAPLDADYRAKVAPLAADYDAKVAPLAADYDAKRASLDADYRAKLAPLDADYDAKRSRQTPITKPSVLAEDAELPSQAYCWTATSKLLR